jgi:methyl-accepting chemotaxis protein
LKRGDAMSRDNNKRRMTSLLVNFSVQHRVILVNLLFMVIVMFITMSIIYTHLLEREYGSGGALNYAFGELTISVSAKLIILYTLLLLTFLLSIIAQLKMTHRVCGPLINFCNTFKKISDGDIFGRIHLREDDLLKKEADDFNDMITKICELVNELKTENERLNTAIKDATGE